MNQDDGDLIDLIAACRGADLGPDRREQLLSRLREDNAFQQAFVDEMVMLGMLKAVQSTEPRWLRLQDELGWGPRDGVGKEDREEAFMRRIGGVLPAPPAQLVEVVGHRLGRRRPRGRADGAALAGGPQAVPVASRPSLPMAPDRTRPRQPGHGDQARGCPLGAGGRAAPRGRGRLEAASLAAAVGPAPPWPSSTG